MTAKVGINILVLTVLKNKVMYENVVIYVDRKKIQDTISIVTSLVLESDTSFPVLSSWTTEYRRVMCFRRLSCQNTWSFIDDDHMPDLRIK